MTMNGNKVVTNIFDGYATFIDPTPYICPKGYCDLLKWHSDDNHLQPLRLEKKAVWLDVIFNSKK